MSFVGPVGVVAIDPVGGGGFLSFPFVLFAMSLSVLS